MSVCRYSFTCQFNQQENKIPGNNKVLPLSIFARYTPVSVPACFRRMWICVCSQRGILLCACGSGEQLEELETSAHAMHLPGTRWHSDAMPNLFWQCFVCSARKKGMTGCWCKSSFFFSPCLQCMYSNAHKETGPEQSKLSSAQDVSECAKLGRPASASNYRECRLRDRQEREWHMLAYRDAEQKLGYGWNWCICTNTRPSRQDTDTHMNIHMYCIVDVSVWNERCSLMRCIIPVPSQGATLHNLFCRRAKH